MLVSQLRKKVLGLVKNKPEPVHVKEIIECLTPAEIAITVVIYRLFRSSVSKIVDFYLYSNNIYGMLINEESILLSVVQMLQLEYHNDNI